MSRTVDCHTVYYMYCHTVDCRRDKRGLGGESGVPPEPSRNATRQTRQRAPRLTTAANALMRTGDNSSLDQYDQASHLITVDLLFGMLQSRRHVGIPKVRRRLPPVLVVD